MELPSTGVVKNKHVLLYQVVKLCQQAEYIALAQTTQEIMFLRMLLFDIFGV
jgi:hypothetical protein